LLVKLPPRKQYPCIPREVIYLIADRNSVL